MLKIDEVAVGDRGGVKEYLELPFRLYGDTPQWVPPLEMEARQVFDVRRHPFYRHSQAAFYLARRDGLVVGRLAVLDNRNWNEYNHSHTAFFYQFECENDLQAADGLFGAAIDWARRRGLENILGPRGFSLFDGMGMLVRGFEHRPAFGLPYNLAYYPALAEACGFVKQEDLVSGYLDTSTRFPEKIHQVAEMVKRRRGLVVSRFRTRRELRKIIPQLKEMYNRALEGTTGNVPLTDEEAKTMADQLMWFADPSLIKIVMKGEQAVGFLFAYPDISAAIQRTRGKLWPLGWLDWLLELRRTGWININGAGMIEGYRGLGGTALLFSEMYKSVTESRFRHADIVQIGMDNENMQREMRDLGIDFYKTHRVYVKTLSS